MKIGENQVDSIDYYIGPRCDIRGVDRIHFSKNVVIQQDCWLNIAYENPHGEYMLELGEGSNVGRRCVLSAANKIILGKHVLLGPNVYISDTSHEYERVGVPIMFQGITSTSNVVELKDGCWIGTNVVIIGDVVIGKGCVIGANSLVNHSIPDYCVAVGNPARVIKAYDYRKKIWRSVDAKEELTEILKAREVEEQTLEPYLSIAIATYNREKDIHRSLYSIFSQIQNNPAFEVVVVNNASTDTTREVLQLYAGYFSNLKVYENEENIGGDPNILKAVTLSKGRYILLHGDDDYFNPEVLPKLLQVIQEHEDCGVFHIDVKNNDQQVKCLEGMSAFLEETSINSSFISSVILKRRYFQEIEEPALFLKSKFNQIYLQYKILKRHPKFCVIHEAAFSYGGNSPSGYNFGEVFMRNYLKILHHFEGQGLDKEVIERDKHRILATTILPWYQKIYQEHLPLDIGNFEEILEELYGAEPYYEEIVKIIKEIQERCNLDLESME